MNIQCKCSKLNNDIHNRIYLNNYLLQDSKEYKKAFTSIDLIDDSQSSIDEFYRIPESQIAKRTTLYIYGVLQSLFCQQDGLFNLYKIIVDSDIKRINDFFDLFNFDEKIRKVRNDIAGHPTNRKNDSEFYFITKGNNSKYKFTYAGYIPQFIMFEVNLEQFIKDQNIFVNEVIDKLFEKIEQIILEHKNKYKNQSLSKIVENSNRSVQLLGRGIWDVERQFQAELGINGINEIITKSKSELLKRNNSIIPESIMHIYKSIDYIINKFKNWFSKGELLNNKDAEIFIIGLENQINELNEMLIEIDNEYNN